MLRRLTAAALAVIAVAAAAPAASATPAIPAPPRPYVALGDSFLAGIGAGSYVEADGCRRSTRSLAALLAADAGTRLIDLTCPGAVTARAIVDAKWIPTDSAVVLIQTGGNDIGFVRLAGSCLLIGDVACRQAVDAGLLRIPTVRASVAEAARRADARAPRARVVVLGYPRLLDSPARCAALMPEGRVRLVNGLQRRLDTALRGAARDAGVRFVDWPASIDEHNLCDPQPWYALPGERIDDLLHPNALAHQVMARHLAAVLRLR